MPSLLFVRITKTALSPLFIYAAVTKQVSIISAIVSDRYQCRGYTVIFFSVMQVIGFSMFYGMWISSGKGTYLTTAHYLASTSSHIRYISLFFSVTGAFCTVPAQNAWLTNNSAPHARRATAVAVAFIIAELGGILSTWLLGSLSPPPNYTSATITFIVMSVCMVLLTTGNIVYLSRQNRLKAERRQRTKKEDEPAGLGDRSAWFIHSL